jgi:hypothetical protein
MKSFRTFFAIYAVFGVASFSGMADTPPELPFDPAGAQMAASQLLKAKGFRVLHQIEGSVSNSNGTVLVQERWIDLAGTEYKTVRWMGEKTKLPANPLDNIDLLRAGEPSGGSWRTPLGGLIYRPAEKRWDAVHLNTADPHRNVLRRLTKEWYLGTELTPGGFPQCCGNGPAAAPDVAAQYGARLQRIQTGQDPMTIKERPDGLLEEIKLRLKNETIVFVKNEFLKEYPVAIPPELQEALKRQRMAARALGQASEPPQNGPAGRGHGMGISTRNVVQVVVEGSPAARAGIVPSDRVISINGTAVSDNPVETADTLRRLEAATVVIEKVDGTRAAILLQKAKLGN